MTWRILNDHENPDLLAPTEFAATYADLFHLEGQVDELRRRLPGTTVLFYDRGAGDPLGLATLIDCEAGALTPGQARWKAEAMHGAGRRYVTVYHQLGQLEEMEAALAGIEHWNIIAAWGQLLIPSHPWASVQCVAGAYLGDGPDLTVVKDPAWHPAKMPGGPLPATPDRITGMAQAASQLASDLQALLPAPREGQ